MASELQLTRKPRTGFVKLLADEWGCSKAYVSRMINHEGCPTDSIEAASKWRLSRSKEGVGHKSKGRKHAPIIAPIMPPAMPQPAPIDKKPVSTEADIEAMAERAQESERNAYAALQALQLMANGIDPTGKLSEAEVMAQREAAIGLVPSAMRIYTQASKTRLDVEKKLSSELERRKRLVRVDEVWSAIQDVIMPSIDALKQMPKLVSSRANPDNPAKAEAAIVEEVNVLLKRMRAAIDRAERIKKGEV